MGHISCVSRVGCIVKTGANAISTAVSPWQFKNIDGGGDWVELSDTLWNYRWQQVVKDVKPDIVEIGEYSFVAVVL
jgi:hypothetical protein